jgi:hypothetical protein
VKRVIWKYRFIIPLLLLPLLLVFLWFQNGLIHGGGDEMLLFANPKRVFEISTSTWFNYSTGFAVLYWLSRASFLFVIFISQRVFLINSVALQAGTFLFLAITGTISVYFLTLKLIDKYPYKNYIGFTAALFYLLNPYSMSQVWGRGQYAQFFSFALLPLSLLIFIIGIKKRNYLYAFLFALVSVIFSTSYGFVTFIVIQWFVFFMYAILEGVSNRKKLTILFINKFFLLCLLVWCLVNSWWLIPFVLTSGSLLSTELNNSSDNIGTLLGVSTYYPFPIIIRLLQSFYFFSQNSYSPFYSIMRFQVMSMIPVVFLSFGIIVSLWKWRRFGFIFFLTTFVIGLIVSLGSNPPFGALFVWIFEHISVLQAFRNPFEKFGLVYALGYSQLVGVGVVFAYQYLKNINTRAKFLIPVIFSLLFITWNIYLWPMWTGKIVASADGKIGLSIPQYYYDVENWLQINNDGYRVMMTPLWSGDGSYYIWNGTLYQGIDPMDFILNPEVISNIGNTPYYFSYAQNIRKYMQQIDMHSALELLRIKYFINRKDATLITNSEKKQYISLSKIIYPVATSDVDSICEDHHVSVPENTQASITCTIPAKNSNWNKIRYFDLTLSTDIPSYVEVVLQDTSGITVGWDGRGDQDYLVGKKTQKVLFSLNSPSTPNPQMNFTHIQNISIYAHPITNFGGSVRTISLEKIGLNPGEKKVINEFHFIKSFGKLDIYAPNNFVVPPEFGTLSSVHTVKDYKDLFQQAVINKNKLNDIGFVINSQNNNSLSLLKKVVASNTVQSSSISNTRFFIQLKPQTTSYLLLSETFYPGWKLFKGVNKNMLDGSFIHNIELLSVASVSEKQHYVANGYANLWVVNGKDSQYAAVFLPQLYAEIGTDISQTGIFICGIILLYMLFKAKRKN